MQLPFISLCLGLLLLATVPSPGAAPVYVRFNTTLGNIDVELLTNDAPKTVANFLAYVNSSAYTNSFIHRSVPGFIFQGGGYYILNNSIESISQNAPVVNEYKVSNTRGTLAMAKLGTGPNTATNQWFFNEADNSANLNNQNGGFTVFGVVANPASLAVMDAISNVPVPNPSPFASPFDQIPLVNYTTGAQVTLQNLVFVNSITLESTQTFPAWQSAYFTVAQLAMASVSGATATPQNDGVPNLLKYLYDINPTRPMTATDRAALPVMSAVTTGTTRSLALTWRQYVLQTGITINVQTSPDLKTWTTVTNPNTTQTGADATTYDPIMQAQVPITGNRQFIRLNVTQP